MPGIWNNPLAATEVRLDRQVGCGHTGVGCIDRCRFVDAGSGDAYSTAVRSEDKHASLQKRDAPAFGDVDGGHIGHKGAERTAGFWCEP
jgi:hypothetical protein